MTDALLMGDRLSADYNLMTFAALVFGSLAYAVYAFALPIVRGSGWRWVPLKIIFLVCFWLIFILATCYLSLLPGRTSGLQMNPAPMQL
jgi:hypothetical protein